MNRLIVIYIEREKERQTDRQTELDTDIKRRWIDRLIDMNLQILHLLRYILVSIHISILFVISFELFASIFTIISLATSQTLQTANIHFFTKKRCRKMPIGNRGFCMNFKQNTTQRNFQIPRMESLSPETCRERERESGK